MSAKSDNLKSCCFCGLTEDNELEFGKFYEHGGIVTHYYCLLLSAKMEQKGSDDEGILGFLINDIKKELRRGKRLVCSYCKKNGATLGCCNTKCKRVFHFPCGLRAGTLNQFFGEFRSFCINHRPKQKIDEHIKKKTKHSDSLCYICYDTINLQDHVGILWAPCCKKDAWFHRKCVQQLAMNAGYFFKCPLCNNNKEFQNEMLEHGIFIPSQDASWELEPNAFQELLYRHNRCDAVTCLCPKGRNHTSMNAKWELVLCRTCGSQGIHMACGQLKWAKPVWDCDECIFILGKVKKSVISVSETINITYDANTDASDSDISVGGTQDKDDLPRSSDSYTRPGPRCYKLQKAKANKSMKSIMCEDNVAHSTQNSFITSTPEVSSSFNLQKDKSTDIVDICSPSKDKNVVSEMNREKSSQCTQLISTAVTSKSDMIMVDKNNKVEIISSEASDKTAFASCNKKMKINNLNQSIDISCKASSSSEAYKQTIATDNIEAGQQPEVVIIDDDTISQINTKPLSSLGSSKDFKVESTRSQPVGSHCNKSELGLKRKYEANICVIGTHTNGVKTVLINKYKKMKINGLEENIRDSCNAITNNKAKLQNTDQINVQFSQKEIKNENINMDQQMESSNTIKNKILRKNGTINMFPPMLRSESDILEVKNHDIAEGGTNNNQSSIPDQSTSKDIKQCIVKQCKSWDSNSVTEMQTPVMSTNQQKMMPQQKVIELAQKEASDSDERYISVSSSFEPNAYSAFSEIESNPNACDRPRLIPTSIPLQDLKFKVRDSNNLQMILYDTFSVNIKMNASTKSHAKDPSTSAGVHNVESSLLYLNDKSNIATCSRIQHLYNSHVTSDKNKRSAVTVYNKRIRR
ncbi:hypothetical protein KPH14_009576 [Odynerus spinipes]|uniref:G2/M phase-specific E3 ubiquitin-protein ligase n=1 Tax=Odynerus spinipes TaxID=1348599 RepID=A0AAD9VRN0_9HYME|nr:hypothetical protein KPH14_009576 [Odynerus spinipes]